MRIGYFFRSKLNKTHQKVRLITYFLEYLIWRIFSRSNKIPVPKINRLLIVNFGALGDIFCSIRSAAALKNTSPELQISLMIPDSYINELNKIAGNLGITFISKDQAIKKQFDATAFFTLDKQLVYMKNMGFKSGNEYTSIKDSIKNFNLINLNRKIKPKFEHKYISEQRVLEQLKFKLNIPETKLKIKKQIKKQIIIHASGKNFFELLNSNKIPAYSWPAESFSEVINFITKNNKYKILLTGLKEDYNLNQKIKELCKNKNQILNLAGKLSINQLFELVRDTRLLISIDTSIVHIAELAETPVITLNGPGFKQVNGALSSVKNVNLSSNFICRNCRIKKECPEKINLCMKNISVQQLLQTISQFNL